ncbi:hypothetical protein OCT51_12655 [Halomonas sp. LR3S48]|uniref:hypothetical protein n=1 Tax=Halomonas sp. LR3S48 TaxID=2982694 RepID=UPI0021E4A749|nr:hypothetical protein [Halomonas sp. LR3S48]UYG02052.1 hypothetical protein OCT51_12655 [Halomonas sp. LR3S48]
MGWDQAAGLRQWANGESQDCPAHVAEMLVELAAGGGSSEARSQAAPRPSAKPASTSAAVTPPRKAGSAQPVTLMVLGLPGTAERHTTRVSELLESWAGEGRRWIGDPRSWRIVALPIDSPHLPLLVTQQSHWALWVDDDLEAFRRGYRMLRQISEQGGPQRLIAVHPPGVGRQGLLANLQYVADAYFGIELLVLAR